MRYKHRYLGLLLAGLLGWYGLAVVADGSEAQIGIDFAPLNPTVDEVVTFEAVLVSGEAAWFFGDWGEYEEDERFQWDFDGGGWTGSVPGAHEEDGVVATHAFRTAGSKTVRLRAWNDRGEWEYVSVTVVVSNDAPNACFEYEPGAPEVGDLVQFDGRCSSDPDGTIEVYTWTVNDGDPVSNGPILQYAFQRSGPYPVELTVTDNGGLTDTIRQWVTVRPAPPVAAFSYSPSAPSVYENIAFDATGSQAEELVWCRWVFGDGDEIEGNWNTYNEVTHQYQNGGVYEVGLWITDSYGAVGHISRILTVTGPAASFTFSPQNPTTQTPVQFHDQSSDADGQIVSWSWAFGDDGFSNDQHPLHTFAVPGTYTVRLTVTGQNGQSTATHSTTRVIQVRNTPPTAQYTFSPESPKVDEMITFSTQGAGDPDGYIVSSEWDFNNDGLTDATGSTVTFAFSTVGAKMVRLTVTDDRGAQSTVVKVVPVQAESPLACFTVSPEDPYTGQTIGFDASCSSDPDGSIILYEWDFTGNGTTDATGMSVSHAYASAGVYPVTLKITDNDGLVGVETKGIPVQAGGTSGDNQPPVGDFTFEPDEGPDVNLHEVITFQSDGSSDPDGQIVSYEWDFDRDGTYDATGQTVTHIFHSGGAKIVTLRVTDNEGAHGFKSRVVPVEFIRPTAEFTYSPETPRVGDIVSFDAGDSVDRDGTIQFYEWDFNGDDRADATGQSIDRVFDQGGRIAVTLTVTDNDGITGMITRYMTVEINNPPTASFDYAPSEPSVGEKVRFSSSSRDSDGVILSYLWEFEEGSSSSEQTPSYTFNTAGAYTVTLTVMDNDGAVSTASETLQVDGSAPVPNANFTYSPKSPSVDEAVAFTDSSTIESGAIDSWLWDFGDGSATTTQRNPEHAFTSEGKYTVTLTVESTFGSSDTVSKEILVGDDVALHAYPNPSSRSATFSVTVSDDTTNLELWIYDLAGNVILRQSLDARESEVEWELEDNSGNSVANGLYLCIITGKDENNRSFHSDVFRLLVTR